MNTRTGRLVRAAAVILIVLGGIAFWPPGNGKNNQWWLGSPAVWGQELLATLDTVTAVTCRERTIVVAADGSQIMGDTWDRFYVSSDSYRRDIYDGNALREIQWYVPDGNDMIQHYVRFDVKCYGALRHGGSFGVHDPIKRIQSYVEHLNEADQLLGEQIIDGRKCIGFEISAAKYGSNPETWLDRIWFDEETRLPVRIEQSGRPVTGDTTRTFTTIQDQFDYAPQVPADAFLPQEPPAGFINAHPDDIRTARDKQVKGEMIFAQVPEGLKGRIAAALKAVDAGSYCEGSARICFRKNAWRNDRPYAGETRYTLWYVLKRALPEGPFELTGSLGVTETLVDFAEKTYRIIDHTGQWPPRHPVVHIFFVAGLIDRADRFYESAEIDGVECFGFDVSAKKYGDNPDGAIHRVWFDAATSLPVRMELHWPDSDGTGASTITQEQFDWDPELPEDFFTPQIPPDFKQVEE